MQRNDDQLFGAVMESGKFSSEELRSMVKNQSLSADANGILLNAIRDTFVNNDGANSAIIWRHIQEKASVEQMKDILKTLTANNPAKYDSLVSALAKKDERIDGITFAVFSDFDSSKAPQKIKEIFLANLLDKEAFLKIENEHLAKIDGTKPQAIISKPKEVEKLTDAINKLWNPENKNDDQMNAKIESITSFMTSNRGFNPARDRAEADIMHTALLELQQQNKFDQSSLKAIFTAAKFDNTLTEKIIGNYA